MKNGAAEDLGESTKRQRHFMSLPMSLICILILWNAHHSCSDFSAWRPNHYTPTMELSEAPREVLTSLTFPSLAGAAPRRRSLKLHVSSLQLLPQ